MVFNTEAEFEDAVIAVLQQHGWNDSEGILEYKTEEELIDNWANIIFQNNIDIDRLNGKPLTAGEKSQLIERVEELKTPYALNSFINGKTITITRDNEEDELHFGKEVSLKIFDRNEIAAGQSRYQIARQPRFAAKSKMLNDRRGDLMLLINGMPLIHIELKKSGVPISQATNQVEKYAHEGVFTGLFRLVQVFVAMNPEDAVYFANPGRDAFNPAFYFHWADFNNTPIHDWKTFTSKLLSIPMAHQLIGFYTVADAKDGLLKVLRSYQYFAASAISDKVRVCAWDDPLPAGSKGRLGGYVWHTTGSGKTMTSFKAAQLVADSKDADKVVFLVDRIELGTQSLDEYRAFADDEDDVQETENTETLRAKLASTNPKDTLIVTSIQKMSRVKLGEAGATKEEIEALAGKRIVFVLDECHRSTFGDMLQDIKQNFPNALFFGFTGTPIKAENQKHGATTSMLFGDELHRYSIADGIRDKNVLGFDPYMVMTYKDKDMRQAVALEKAKASNVTDVLADEKKSEVFYYYINPSKVPMAGEIASNGNRVPGIEDYVPNVQYAPESDHVEKVVEDIIEQFPVLSRGGKFHAILATSSIREACNYYELLTQKAPHLRVTALFDPSIDNNDGAIEKEEALVKIIEDYNANYDKDFTIKTWARMKKDISSRLAHKKPYVRIEPGSDERIDLLIVVDQMLTGFDSKWLNTLYLDKVMEYESIIQAFSRTNRLFDQEKPHGTIRYYRKPHTMKRNVEAALKLYSGDQPLDLFVNKLPENLAAMNARFEEIAVVFKAEGVENFAQLPESNEAKRMFAKLFNELNEFLEAAQLQGFNWEQKEYAIEQEDGGVLIVSSAFGEREYQTLVQRYKELFSAPPGPVVSAVPYDLVGYITEIDTGLIDADYMNANFKKWLKALDEDNADLDVIKAELHRSFASLSVENQRFAELFLHDVERGDVSVDSSLSFMDYVTSYAHAAKNAEIEAIVSALGVDEALLSELLGLDISEQNINEFGRFDDLKESVDKERAKAFFEEKLGTRLPPFKVNMEAAKLLKQFILTGGFDINQFYIER